MTWLGSTRSLNPMTNSNCDPCMRRPGDPDGFQYRKEPTLGPIRCTPLSACSAHANRRCAGFSLACLRCAPRPAARLGEQFDHLSIVSRNVIGLATGDKAPIDHDLFVAPVCPAILEVRPERRPRRHATPSRTAGLDNHPGSMAD